MTVRIRHAIYNCNTAHVSYDGPLRHVAKRLWNHKQFVRLKYLTLRVHCDKAILDTLSVPTRTPFTNMEQL